MVDVKKILSDLGIIYKITGQNARTSCWNPNHKDTAPSMNIHLETGIYHCFGCHISGHIVSIAKEKLGLSDLEANTYINQQLKGGTNEEEIYNHLMKIMDRKKGSVEKLLECTHLEHTLLEHNIYLENRNITPQDMKKWNIGLVNKPGHQCNGWIYIPVYQEGILRTWFCRCTYNNDKIYGYTKNESNIVVGYKRSDLLFGLDECDKSKELYIVEGIFDKISLEKIRVQVVACLGNYLLPEQLQKLKKFTRIVIVPDNDIKKKDEGLYVVHAARSLLNDTEVYVGILPLHRKDVNECTLQELLQVKYNIQALPEFLETERYQNWVQQMLLQDSKFMNKIQ